MKPTDNNIEKLLSECKVKPSADLREKILSDAEFPAEEVKSAFVSFRPRKWMYAVAVCCFVFIISIFSFLGFANEDYMQVYVDVNPSISLSVNRFGKVVNTNAVNDDAEAMLGNINFNGMNADDAMEEILILLGNEGYLDDAELFITTKCKNEKQAAKMQEKLHARSENVKHEKNFNCQINQGHFSEEEKEYAKEHGISPVKYNIILQIIEKDDSYTVDSLKDKAMKELKDILKSLQ